LALAFDVKANVLSEAVKTLEQKELVDLDLDWGKFDYATITLSKKGRNEYAKLASVPSVINTQLYRMPQQSENVTNVRFKFARSRAVCFLKGINVPCLPDEKPKYSDLLNVSLSDLPQAGYFYSSREIKQKLNSERFLGSRFVGIHFSPYAITVLYVPTLGAYSMLRLSHQAELKLVDELKLHFSSPEIRGLLLPSGNAAIYETITGYKHGLQKNSQQKQVSSNTENGFYILTHTQKIYPRFYIIPVSKRNEGMLYYLLSRNYSHYLKDCFSIYNSLNNFTANEFSNSYFGIENTSRNRAVFLPLIEMSQLSSLADDKTPISIITDESLADAISHSIRRTNICFFDTQGNPFSCNFYNERGYPINEPIKERKVFSRHKPRRHQTTIYLSTQQKKELKAEAEKLSLSLNKLIIYRLFPSDYFSYTEEQKE